MKRTENARADILSKKLGYEEKQKQSYPEQITTGFYDTRRTRSFHRLDQNSI
jgi:hypothetical protein